MPQKAQSAQAQPDFIPLSGGTDGPDFIPLDHAGEAATVAPASIGNTGATLSPAAAPTWLQSAESDLRYGGKRTALGKILGVLQGTGNGYSGAMGGVSPAAAQFMASPAFGLIHGAQGAQETVSGHPLTGTLHSIEGGLEAATIPSMVVSGPASEAIQAVPSAKHAGEVLGQIAEHANNLPITPSATSEPLLRLFDLGQRGSTLPKAVTQLAKRVTAPDAPALAYQEARDFVSKISQLSADERMTLTPTIKAALGKLRTGLHADIADTAAAAGHAGEYASAIREYARSSQIADTVSKLGSALKKWGVGAAGIGGAAATYEHFRK